MTNPHSTRTLLARALPRGPLLGLLAVWTFFALLCGHNFIAWDNQRLMLLQTTVIATAAIGATVIIISGGIDLSVGSTIALCTMVVALLLKAGASPLAAALGGILSGIACGGLVGLMVVGRVAYVASIAAGALVSLALWSRTDHRIAALTGLAATTLLIFIAHKATRKLPLPPFIATLGMWGAIRGLAKGLGNNQPVYPDDNGWLPVLMSQRTSGLLSFLPDSVWITLILAATVAFILVFTVFGRHTIAIGSNEQAARYCGVPISRTKLGIYMLGVGCAGLAGVLQFSYLNMGDPTTASGYELRIIAAAVIGGASLAGGTGSIRGALIGALIMTIVDNGCTKLGLDNWVQEMVTGGLIVTAVALDRMRRSDSTA